MAMKWKPIETAPKDGTKIIAYTNDGMFVPVVCQCVFDNGAWWPDFYEYVGSELNPTHWVPMPEFPA